MKYTLVFISLALFALSRCKKDDDTPPAVPTLTTTAVTNISGSTAQSGGVITDNGGATITTSGICWSKTNNTPTITDDTAQGVTSSGSFTSMLKNLQSSTTYYVRAYAINSAGTGYGNVVTFNTSNGAPEVRNIHFIGTPAVTNKINVRYIYSDSENDPESGTTFQWYVANDTVGATVTVIAGATDSIYTIVIGDQNKFLRVAITPKSSAGTSPGAATNSYWIGPVGPEPTSVTFTYNGQTVTYGILTSPTTGKRWLDRNLGATRVATASDDYLAYGDLFQWGRPADGHQLITWTNSTTGAGVNGITSTKATSDTPGNNLFISPDPNSPPDDWRDDNNGNRWGTIPQGPCPVGWHVPSKSEWLAETGITNSTTAYSQLKLPAAGIRLGSNGVLLSGNWAAYWSSTVVTVAGGGSATTVFYYVAHNTLDNGGISNLSRGYSVRCIKN